MIYYLCGRHDPGRSHVTNGVNNRKDACGFCV